MKKDSSIKRLIENVGQPGDSRLFINFNDLKVYLIVGTALKE
jgi:hypothetical protein